MARKDPYWAPKARAPLVARIHEVHATTNLEAKVDELTRKFDPLMAEKESSSSKVVSYVRHTEEDTMFLNVLSREHRLLPWSKWIL